MVTISNIVQFHQQYESFYNCEQNYNSVLNLIKTQSAKLQRTLDANKDNLPTNELTVNQVADWSTRWNVWLKICST